MEQIENKIPIRYVDNDISNIIKTRSDDIKENFTKHYSQGEDFFIRFSDPIIVPSLPVHHPVRTYIPDLDYRNKIKKLVTAIHGQLPLLLGGMEYFFDSTEVHRPSFYKVFQVAETYYIYLLRLHLIHEPQRQETIVPGSNDTTASFKTDFLYVDADLIPLESFSTSEGKLQSFDVVQSISETWVGERGRGYFVQGIWLDRELTKFFSSLVMPEGKRFYPYYALSCKYKAICSTVSNFSFSKIKKRLTAIHKARMFIEKNIQQIESSLKSNDFSKDLVAFTQLNQRIPSQWKDEWNTIEVKMYLNEEEMREYQIIDD